MLDMGYGLSYLQPTTDEEKKSARIIDQAHTSSQALVSILGNGNDIDTQMSEMINFMICVQTVLFESMDIKKEMGALFEKEITFDKMDKVESLCASYSEEIEYVLHKTALVEDFETYTKQDLEKSIFFLIHSGVNFARSMLGDKTDSDIDEMPESELLTIMLLAEEIVSLPRLLVLLYAIYSIK